MTAAEKDFLAAQREYEFALEKMGEAERAAQRALTWLRKCREAMESAKRGAA